VFFLSEEHGDDSEGRRGTGRSFSGSRAAVGIWGKSGSEEQVNGGVTKSK